MHQTSYQTCVEKTTSRSKPSPCRLQKKSIYRIQITLGYAQPREQAGFRFGFSTMEQIQPLIELIIRSKESEIPMALAFIDSDTPYIPEV